MPFLRLQIVRFVDEAFPGFVAGEFSDASGTTHTVIDKVPGLARGDLWSDSRYPQPGVAACVVLKYWEDAEKGPLALITLARPWGLADTNDEAEFVVLQSQIAEEVDSC